MREMSILERRYQREHTARLEAEAILESKSLELHESKLLAEKAAQDLANQNIQIQAILDNAAEGIIAIDGQMNIASFNSAAARIFQISSEEAIGRSFVSLFEDLTPDVLDNFCLSTQKRLDPREHRSLADTEIPAVVEVTLSKTNGHDRNLMIAIVRDRTKGKQLEAQLALAQKMEAIGQLSAGIAHEINSPMQYVNDNTMFLKYAFSDIDKILNFYSELASAIKEKRDLVSLVEEIDSHYEELDLDFTIEEVPQAIEQTLFGAQRVNSIVAAMKVFSHPGGLSDAPFDLNASIESSITVSKNEWKYVSEVETNLDADLPNCFGDQNRINQALLNLIVNAAHAIAKRKETESKDYKGRIFLQTKRDGDLIELTIEDNGMGIDEDKISLIFDPFYTTKAVGKGTGQGLSITHSIITELHKGTIEVQSEVGVGTEFKIRIPFEKPAE